MPWHMQNHSCILVTSELGCDLLPVDVKATMDLNPKISQAAQIATECTHQIISHIPSITGATWCNGATLGASYEAKVGQDHPDQDPNPKHCVGSTV